MSLLATSFTHIHGMWSRLRAVVGVLDVCCSKVVADADAGTDDTEDADTGTTFAEVDLTEKEWYDYDDKGDFPVQITDIEVTFERV